MTEGLLKNDYKTRCDVTGGIVLKGCRPILVIGALVITFFIHKPSSGFIYTYTLRITFLLNIVVIVKYFRNECGYVPILNSIEFRSTLLDLRLSMQFCLQ